MNEELPEYPNVYTCTDCYNSTFRGKGIIKEDNNIRTCKEDIECVACGCKWIVKYPMSELPDLELNDDDLLCEALDTGGFEIYYDIDNCRGLETQLTFTSFKSMEV